MVQADVRKNRRESCTLEILLEYLKDIDFNPLLELCLEIIESEIEAVDIRGGSACVLNGEYALALMRAIGQRLRSVDLQDTSFGKEFLRYILVFIMRLFEKNSNYICLLCIVVE